MYVKIVTQKGTSIHSEEFKPLAWAGEAHLKNQKVRMLQAPYETVISLRHGTDCIKHPEYLKRSLKDLSGNAVAATISSIERDREFAAHGTIRNFLTKWEIRNERTV